MNSSNIFNHIFKIIPYSLILFISLINSNYSFASLLEVSSVYNTPSGQQKVTGTGFLIGLECSIFDVQFNPTLKSSDFNTCKRNFVLTAAHVSQGQVGLIIKRPHSTENLEIIGRLANNWLDIELIELNPTIIKSLNIVPLVRCPDVYMCSNSFSNINSNLIRINFVPLSPETVFWIYNFGELSSWYQSKLWKPLNFFPIVLDKPSFDVLNEISNPVYRWTYDNLKLVLPHSIIPGMSGSPLLSNPIEDLPENFGFKRLIGMSLQNDFYFRESIFASNVAIGQLLIQYLFESKRGLTLNSPEWKYDTDSTFRVVKTNTHSIIEKLQIHINTGGSGRGDIGKTNNNKIEHEFNSDLAIVDSNNVQNAILGFKYSDLPLRAIWADIPSLNTLITKNGNNINTHLNLIMDGHRLTEFLQEKLINSYKILNNINNSENDSIKSIFSFFTNKASNSLAEESRLSSSKQYICEIELIKSINNEDLINVNIKLLKKPNVQNDFDEITIKLNSNGKNILNVQNKNTVFSPRFIINSKNNYPYIIDIRQLFFTDLYEIHSESEEGFTNIPDPFKIAATESALIKIRNINKNQSTNMIMCQQVKPKEN